VRPRRQASAVAEKGFAVIATGSANEAAARLPEAALVITDLVSRSSSGTGSPAGDEAARRTGDRDRGHGQVSARAGSTRRGRAGIELHPGAPVLPQPDPPPPHSLGPRSG